MKRLILLIAFISCINVFSQNENEYEKPPVFPECESESIDGLDECFNATLYKFINENYEVPVIVENENYNGQIVVLFEVDKDGRFNMLYADAIYDELKTEASRVFELLPQIKPPMYNGNATYSQYSIAISIPLQEYRSNAKTVNDVTVVNKLSELEEKAKQEFDSINSKLVPYTDDEYDSELNIPFTHTAYSRFDREMNLVGTNSHTASKPYVYSDVVKYHDFKSKNDALSKGNDSWWSRKLWDEHLVQVKGKDYWFTIDPVVDFSVGKNTNSDHDGTFNNTRGVFVQGGLGKKLNYSATILESQGRFPDYFNQFAESLKPFGPDPGIIPGRGIAKRFKKDAYDYPVAEGYLSYSPADFLNIQFGHAKNFIGDGYRSLLLSDNASPNPFLKLNTKFWKIKYTNTWMWLRDVRPEVTEDGAFLTKYMANHYLSWNVSKKFNLGLFESVMWTNTNNRGFDINYLNPVIFYRAIEFATGPDAGNAIIGLTSKYKWNDKVNIYGQFILDEFSLSDVKDGNKSWKNKFGFQLGVKYYNAFDVKNLMLQFEHNQVRPYTYSHNSIVLNYAHNYQSMAHLWNSNFKETIMIGRYHYKRWSADAKIVIGIKGFDFNTADNMTNYGGDIFGDERERPSDSGIEIGQGIKTNIFHAELQAGYLLNPRTNLKVFSYISYRNFNPEAQTPDVIKNNTLWFNIGVRTDLFNWYFDF